MNYSIIIPLYNEEESVSLLHDELVENIQKLASNDRKFEIIYINDGSNDSTFDKVLNLNTKNLDVKLINNIKNLSQSISINNGIETSKYDNLIFLDGDGQNDPSDIVLMVKEFEKGFDLVHGYRKKRKDNFFTKTLPSLIANFIVRLVSKSKIIDHGCSLKIIKKKFLNKEKLWGDFHRLLAARLANDNLKIIQVETNHRHRKYGKSNYGFMRVLRVIIDLIYIYLFHKSYNNFYIIGYLAVISFLLSIFSFIYMIKLKYFNSISFIETPLPTVTVLFGISSLIFFAFLFIIQLILNLKNDIKDNKKNYDEIELS